MTQLSDIWPLLAGAVGVTLAIVSLVQVRIREMNECGKILDFAISEAKLAISAAERVLSNEQTPAPVRKTVLIVLKITTSKKLTALFFADLFNDSNNNRVDVNNPTSMALRQLAITNPELAADADAVIRGFLLSGPILCLESTQLMKIVRAGAMDTSTAIAKLPVTANDDYGTDLKQPYAAASSH